MSKQEQYSFIAQVENPHFSNLFVYCSDYINCLEPLLEELGWYGDRKEIAEALPHFNEILDLPGFHKVMGKLHYQYRCFDINLNQLDSRVFPCLFKPKDGAALVIKKREENGLIVFDGSQNTTRIIYDTDIEGTAFLFHSTCAETESIKNFKQTWFGGVLKRYKKLFYQVFLITLMLNIISVATPLFIMSTYDRVIGTGSISMLVSFGVGLGIALLGTVVLLGLRAKILAYVGARLDDNIGDDIFAQLISLPANNIENVAVGNQVARLKSFDTVRDFFTGPLINLILELPFAIFFIAVVALLAGPVAFVPIGMVCIYLLVTYFTQGMIDRKVRSTTEYASKRQAFLIEALNNQRAIKYSAAEDIWLNRFKAYSAQAIFANFKTSTIASIMSSFADMLMLLAALTILVFCIIKVIAGTLTTGAMIAVMMLQWRILSPLKSVLTASTRLSQVRSSIRQINALMSMPSEGRKEIITQPITIRKNNIAFYRVSLRYQLDMEPVLSNINLSIKSNELVMIMGSNGAGKSSLLSLVLRLYQPQSGGVLLGNRDIRQFDSKLLRSRIGYVPQENHFFYGTISQNLRLSNITVTDEKLVEATIVAGVYDEIKSLPEGFNTRIGDLNKTQFPISFLQRLSLARAYLKDPIIYLLDEPASGFDYETQKVFLSFINKLKGKVTILMVTHNPEHLQMADHIVYLKEGCIELDGTPEQVMPQIIRSSNDVIPQKLQEAI